jgi:hypothetical protein
MKSRILNPKPSIKNEKVGAQLKTFIDPRLESLNHQYTEENERTERMYGAYTLNPEHTYTSRIERAKVTRQKP